MNIRKFVLNSFLLAIGVLLHQITPPLVLGMKPDFSLVMLFIILLFNKDFKSCITSGLAVGVFTALTTGFPMGQVPNIIDKLITTIIIFIIVKALGRHIKDKFLMIFITSVGTLISGTVFLTSAAILVGLPGKIGELFLLTVLPAALINTIVGIVLYNVVNISIRRSNFKES